MSACSSESYRCWTMFNFHETVLAWSCVTQVLPCVDSLSQILSEELWTVPECLVPLRCTRQNKLLSNLSHQVTLLCLNTQSMHHWFKATLHTLTIQAKLSGPYRPSMTFILIANVVQVLCDDCTRFHLILMIRSKTYASFSLLQYVLLL